MSTYIDGIGASQNIDSSGEIVDIAGLDISSLEVDGSLNWEHKKDVPEQLVGRVLKAKKIFSDKDCEDDRQKYFWNKCKTPYLYILGVLFDDYVDSARHVAGIFRYDHDNRGKQERDTLGFSVEGAKLPGAVHGMTITRSIARKITITNFNCNKVAAAELAPTAKKPKDDKDGLDNIFKTESMVEIEVFKVAQQSSIWDLLKKESLMKKAKALFSRPMKKDVGAGGLAYGSSTGLTGSGPISPTNMMTQSEPEMARSEEMEKHLKVVPPSNPNGTKIGRTSSGKDVHSHARIGETGFNVKEHEEAAVLHQKAANANPKMAQHHNNKANLHNSAAMSAKNRAIARSDSSKKDSGSTKHNLLHDPHLSGKVDYKKSETLTPGEESNGTEANKKQQRARRAQEAYPNSDKRHFDKHKINRSSSNTSSQNQQRQSIPNQQVSHTMPALGAEHNNMLHDKLLAPKQTMHKSVSGGVGGNAGFNEGANMIETSSATSAPKKPRLGTLNKALEAGSYLASPNMLTGGAALGKESLMGVPKQKPPTIKPANISRPNAGYGAIVDKTKSMKKGGAYSGNVPRDKKIKELQQKIDSGTYKPDSKKTAEAMLKHPSKPLKKSDAYIRAEADYAQWSKREEFESFMKSRMPHMTKGEIRAFGQAMLLNKSMRLEKSLEEMSKTAETILIEKKK